MAEPVSFIPSFDTTNIMFFIFVAAVALVIVGIFAFVWWQWYKMNVQYKHHVLIFYTQQGGLKIKRDKGYLQTNKENGRSVFKLLKDKISLYDVDLKLHAIDGRILLFQNGEMSYTPIKFGIFANSESGQDIPQLIATLSEDREWVRQAAMREIEKRRNPDWLKANALILVGLGFVIIIFILFIFALQTGGNAVKGIGDIGPSLVKVAEIVKSTCGPQAIANAPAVPPA